MSLSSNVFDSKKNSKFWEFKEQSNFTKIKNSWQLWSGIDSFRTLVTISLLTIGFQLIFKMNWVQYTVEWKNYEKLTLFQNQENSTKMFFNSFPKLKNLSKMSMFLRNCRSLRRNINIFRLHSPKWNIICQRTCEQMKFQQSRFRLYAFFHISVSLFSRCFNVKASKNHENVSRSTSRKSYEKRCCWNAICFQLFHFKDANGKIVMFTQILLTASVGTLPGFGIFVSVLSFLSTFETKPLCTDLKFWKNHDKWTSLPKLRKNCGMYGRK